MVRGSDTRIVGCRQFMPSLAPELDATVCGAEVEARVELLHAHISRLRALG
jgi:hypothetical protein